MVFWFRMVYIMTLEFCNKKNIKIYSDREPCIAVRSILPFHTTKEKEDIKRYPFLNKRNINFFIHYKDEIYTIFLPKNYKWDGATIPRLFWRVIGPKGDNAFLLASMVHDKMCECKWLVKNNRKLSSLIFKELLLSSGVGEIKASIMYNAVDTYQKFVSGWSREKKNDD